MRSRQEAPRKSTPPSCRLPVRFCIAFLEAHVCLGHRRAPMHPAAFPLTRAFLYAMIGSVVLSAVLGIIAILAGGFGWLEVRILLTTVTIAVTRICGLADGAYLSLRGKHPLPGAGIALALGAGVLILIGIWGEVQGEMFWKVTAAASVFAVACAHLSLLSLARLAEWFQ